MLALIAFVASALLPLSVSAHEVYVLSPETVRMALAADSPNPFSAYIGNEHNFFFWGLVSFIVMSTILAASIFHVLERQAEPFLAYLKRFALPVARITVGICLIGFGSSAHLFGTELLFSDMFAALTPLVQGAFLAGGVALIAGLYTRYIAALMIGVYAYAASVFGSYLLTYTDHLGAFLLLFALGGGAWSLDRIFRIGRLPWLADSVAEKFAPYAFAALRMLFGFGIMFAALYGKYIHSELALQTVIQYRLTDFFPFDPLFIVLGALIIEFLAGLMLFIGVAIRWTGLFLIFWLTLSQIYFQEIWWVHAVLFGLGFAIFCHGYDRYSIEGHVLKRGRREPVL